MSCRPTMSFIMMAAITQGVVGMLEEKHVQKLFITAALSRASPGRANHSAPHPWGERVGTGLVRAR